MAKNGPIIIVEDDLDDHEIIREAFKELGVTNEVKFFFNGQEALDYLRSTGDSPFIVLCDINMPLINGLQLRSVIELSPSLKRKAIPFIFFSTTAAEREVNLAYDLTVQGYFEKASDFQHLTRQLELILLYWTECKHPNSFR